jgi:hypothetical protein
MKIKLFQNIISLSLLLTVVVAATEAPASAYLDPGAGSMATQLLIASAAGLLYTFRNWFRTKAGKGTPKP